MNNEDQAIVIKEQPQEIVLFANTAAKQLVNLVRQNNWSIKIGQGEHLRFEAWQTVGTFFGYTVKTESTEYVEYGGVKGFNAKAVVLDRNGKVIGGAESLCLSDEKNWYGKPLFSLKSMAQTRAAGKAFRQILSWVVVLAGFKPTPAEEMSEDLLKVDPSKAPAPRPTFRDDPTNPLNENTCSECKNPVSIRVRSYSLDVYKKVLCMDCQKNVIPDNVKFASESINPTPIEDVTIQEAEEIFIEEGELSSEYLKT